MGQIRSSVFILAVLTIESALAGHGWRASFEEAEEVAARQQVPLLVHFHAPWCGPCRQMDEHLFSLAAVQRALQNGLAAVKVDITERPDLKERFEAESIPRDAPNTSPMPRSIPANFRNSMSTFGRSWRRFRSSKGCW